MSTDRDVIYKICTRADWEGAKASGSWDGAPVDKQDGFMHFSTAPQYARTLQLYFKGQTDLVKLTIDTATLEKACADFNERTNPPDNARAKVQWDMSASRGQEFPHLYFMPLPVSAVREVESIPDDRE